MAVQHWGEPRLTRDVDVIILTGFSAEDLIVLKSFANRVQDWRDVDSIVERQGKQNLDWNYIFASVAPLVELKDEPAILERLKSLQ